MGKAVDVTSALRFDLRRGAAFLASPADAADSSPAPRPEERAVVVSAEAFAELVSGAGPVVGASAARLLGASMGRRVAERLGGTEAVRAAPLEAVTSALAGEVSVAGLGRVALERWGHAMVLVLEHAPRIEATFLAAVLEGAVDAASRATPKGPSVASLVIDAGEEIRVLVSSSRAVNRVRAWLGDGLGWRQALARLQERRGP